ncbi:MAG: hypothetical protein J3Q66DRAFT_355611 [Benniella sp.]|nr:MAG: hypothetical protein J3Q66DRAFT_355611 [Benniella sp.]
MHLSDSSPEGSPPPSALPSGPLQHFYSPALDLRVIIEAHIHPISNEPFIYWRQIENSFNTASFVRGVSFMVDHNEEMLEPMRIPCYPDVELEVVLAHELPVTLQKTFRGYAAAAVPDPYVDEAAQPWTPDDSVLPVSGTPSSTRDRPTVQAMINPSTLASVVYSDVAPLPLTPDTDDRSARASAQSDTNEFVYGTGLTSGVTEEQAPDVDGAADILHIEEPSRPTSRPLLSLDADSYLMHTDLGKALDRYSARMTLGDSFMQGYRGLFALYVQDFLAGQCTGAESLKMLMTGLLNKVLGEMERGIEPNIREKALTLQEEAIIALGIMQNRVQALMTKTYEPFEDTAPRLFIILRVGPQRLDRENLSNNKFRLYFLCECGKHTEQSIPVASSSSSPSIPRHHVHLVEHNGYDLTRPNAFLAKFGSYVLTVMEMLRYGITSDEFVVPSMANLGVLDGIDPLGDHDLDVITFQSALDDTMDYIKGQMDGTLKARNFSLMDIMKQAVLEGHDLCQLGSFLERDGNPRPCGDMYRIVTTEGFVKWVCTDHFLQCGDVVTYRKSIREEIIRSNTGTLDEKEGIASIICDSSASAQKFYGFLAEGGVLDLKMEFRWDASRADVKDLCSAVNSSSVTTLSLRGLTGQERSLGQGTSSQANRESRLGHLTRLMDSGKLQALSIEGFELLDSGLGLGGTPVLGLRKLEMGLGNFSKNIQGSFFRLLERLTDLVDLRLHCDDMDQVYNILQRQLRILRLPQLSVITLVSPNNSVCLNLQARIMSMMGICPTSKRMIEDHDNLTTIHMPFEDGKLASTISWFERQYGHRRQSLTVSFSTGSKQLGIITKERIEPVVEVELLYQAPIGSSRPVGQRLEGDRSVIYVRWCDNDLMGTQDLTDVSTSGNTAILDFQILKTMGVRKILQSLILHPRHDGLEIICYPCSEDVVQLIAFGLNTRSLSRLARLKLGGEYLNDWIKDISRVLGPQSLPSLEELCVAETSLSPESAKWIASMLLPRSLQRISLKDLRLASSSWSTIISSMNLSNTRHIDLSGSSISQAAFETMANKVPQNSRLETLTLCGVRWTGAFDQRECNELVWRLKTKAPSIEVKYQ